MLKMKPILLAVTCTLVFMSIECTPCSRVQSVDITDGVKYENSSIVYEGTEYKSGTWYELEENGTALVLGCPCIGRKCLHRCCSPGSAFVQGQCAETDASAINPFNPPVYNGKVVSSVQAHQHFFYLYQRPCIDSYLVDSAAAGEELYIQQNGTLFEVSTGGPIWHDPGSYCVEMYFNENSSEAGRLVAGVCFEDVVTDDSPVLYTAYAVGLILSVPFLLATFLIYAFIPELRNLHGMCLMAYCGGLIVAYPFLAYLKLHVGRVGVAMTGCLVVAFIVYYAFQTSFFWLNVMCFDIWRTFRSATPCQMGCSSHLGYRGGSTNKRRERRRFLLYGLYAWGVPLVLTGLTAAMQFSDLPNHIIKPGFGTKRCWFVDWVSDLVYFFTPVLVLVVCNVTFFAVTAHRIRSIRQETAILKGAESSRSDKLKKDKQRYGLYLKLFMVMGVNWSVELISFAVGGSNWYWIVTDISNIGLGVFVFFIFVWKKKVRNLVQKRFRNIFGLESTESDTRAGKWNTTSTAPTEDTRISSDDSALRLKDMH
nr:G-protein coupled receptor Mth2 isoform X2 [Helicoverpa armigera]